jgi:DNA repair protein RecO (recombination protein O)
MRKSITTEALVLAATDVGEEDRILTFLTPGSGLLKAAATSARNLKKGRAAPLDLFVHTLLTINIPGKEGKLKRISSAETIDPFLGIRADYERLCAASYMGQMTGHCVQEDDPSRGTWELLLYCLRRLDSGTAPFTVILPFEVIHLREMGILPDLERCLKCHETVSGEAHLDTRGGGIVHRQCTTMEYVGVLSGGDLAVLRYCAQRKLSAISKLLIKEEDALRVFNLLHPFSVHHLGYEAKALKMLKK